MRATLNNVVLMCSLGCSYPVSFAAVEQHKDAKQKGNDQHTAYALLHLAYREPRLLIGGDNVPALERSEFDVFRRTQSVLIRSPLVLNAALRQPNINSLELVKQNICPTRPDGSPQPLTSASLMIVKSCVSRCVAATQPS